MTLPTLTEFRRHVQAFVDRCAPSAGVYDEAAWDASGIPRMLDPRCAGRTVRVGLAAGRGKD